MSEQEKNTAYQKLLEATDDGQNLGVIDAHTMHTLRYLADQGENVDEIPMPMLAQLRNSKDAEKVTEHATVLSKINSIIALTATPAQLLELMEMPEIISLEASRDSAGDWE